VCVSARARVSVRVCAHGWHMHHHESVLVLACVIGCYKTVTRVSDGCMYHHESVLVLACVIGLVEAGILRVGLVGSVGLVG
jgi:hypothetical protein